MATKYVDSAAGGANDGTSWTDAWTSILSADAAATAAGDSVLVDDGHSETGTIGTLNFSGGTLANPIKVLCVDKADDSLSSGALINNNSGALAVMGNVQFHGLTFRQSAASTSGYGTTDGITKFHECTIDHQGNATFSLSANTRSSVELDDCTITMASSTTTNVTVAAAGTMSILTIKGGTITARSAGQTTLFSNSGNASQIHVSGADCSANAVTNLGTLGGTGGTFHMHRCKLPTYTNVLSATPSTPDSTVDVLIEASVAGTISAPSLGLTAKVSRTGSMASSLSRYRTGGADDGEQANPHSWEMISNTNALEQVSWLESPPLPMRWVNAGDAQTVTVYVASGGTLNDDDFWIEVLSPNETDSPNTTAQGRHQSTRMAFQGTPAALTTDGTSTWNGTGVGTKQKITVTINPAVAGPVIVRACLAKPSTTVYVDPKLDVA